MSADCTEKEHCESVIKTIKPPKHGRVFNVTQSGNVQTILATTNIHDDNNPLDPLCARSHTRHTITVANGTHHLISRHQIKRAVVLVNVECIAYVHSHWGRCFFRALKPTVIEKAECHMIILTPTNPNQFRS